MSIEIYCLNEKIALLKGWKQDLSTSSDWVDPEGFSWIKPGIPDWASSKDLLQEEKLKLRPTHLNLFQSALRFIQYRDAIIANRGVPVVVNTEMHMASAFQEAEAYLMVLEGLAKP
jgi:hypothetical protein